METTPITDGTAGPGGALISSPMVGREAELETMRRQLGQLHRGQGGIVCLVGEAGIGKSRLLREALAAEEARRVTFLVGRSLAVGQTLSFHPFTDLLRGWAGIAGGAEEDEALERLEQAVRGACGDETDEIVPFVASLMGLRPAGAHAARLREIEGEALERLILRSMRVLLRGMASAGPLVLLFEDLHWADRSSVLLLEHLMRLVAESPILFVFAFRPDLAGSGQRVADAARAQHPLQSRLIRLRPLDAEQAEQLVRNLLRSEAAPRGALERIAAKADGNPFFLEEVLRSLIDEGAIELRDGRPRVTERIESIAVPGSVRDVVAARLDRLEPETRSLLRVAAVIGRAFLGRLLAHVRGDDADLESRLDLLKDRGVLLERRTHRTAAHARRSFVGEVEFVFQHALVQETIYDSIEPEARRALHGRVAAAIEAIFAARLADFHGMLAYHYVRAENPEKAEEYLFKAGEEAARAAASSEALTFFREASRLYLRIHGGGGEASRKALLERNIGLALVNTGRLAESIPHFDQALAHLGDPIPRTLAGAVRQFAGDAAAVGARLLLPGFLFRSKDGRTQYRDNLQVRYPRIKAQSTSEPARLLFDYTRAIRLLNQTDPGAVPDQAIGLYSGFAAMFAYSGLSFRTGRRFLALADQLRRPGHAKDLFDHRCLVCIHNYLEGIWDDASGHVDEGTLRQALRYGGLWEVNTYLGLDADRLLRRGDFAAARRRIDQLADIAETYGFDFARANHSGETTLLLLEERRLDAALDAANLYQTSVGDAPLRVLALGSKAKAQVLLGARDAAAETLAAAEQVVASVPFVPPWHLSAFAAARLHYDLATLEAVASQSERDALVRRAHTHARLAQRVATRVAVQRGEIHRLTAHLYQLTGDPASAARWLARAIAECDRLGARPELARAHLDAATWGLDVGDGRGRDAHLARARDLFDELGLLWETATSTPAARRAA